MNVTDFEQFFYRDLVVPSVTTGGHFQLLDIPDEDKKQTEEFIHVSLILYVIFLFLYVMKIYLEEWC